MSFSDVQHQDRALRVLRLALESGRTPHAYLFDGPEGVGKERTALALAARLLCQARAAQTVLPDDAGGLFAAAAAVAAPPPFEACGRCASCQVFAAGNHPDFHLVDRLLARQHPDPTVRRSKALFLVVDVVRQFLIEPATMKPALGPCRVFVVRDAERMNEEAQNALLKTLEEPPGRAYLVLLTSAGNRLLPTIRSRCQRVAFNLLPREFVEAQLGQRTRLRGDELRTVANLAGGSLGQALRWQAVGLSELVGAVAAGIEQLPETGAELFAKRLVELGGEIAGRLGSRAAEEERPEEPADDEETEGAGRAARGAKVATDELRGGLKLVFVVLAAVLRDSLLIRHAAPRHLAQLPAEHDRSQRIARRFDEQLDNAIHGMAHVENMLDRNVAPQLCCERIATLLAGVPAPV